MTRTKLADRKLPDYTFGEEIFNMVTHIVGAAFAVSSLTLCITFAIEHNNRAGLVGGIIYSIMMLLVYTMSSIYHGMRNERVKKVFQVIDHCSIYAMIFGTYVPILLTGIYEYSKTLFIIQSIVLVVGTAIGVTFTAIDFHRYAVISTGGYFAIGWSIIFAFKHLLNAFPHSFVYWILSGGIVYTLGIIFYGIGVKKRYFHSIFHLFIIVASILQFVGIFKYCI